MVSQSSGYLGDEGVNGIIKGIVLSMLIGVQPASAALIALNFDGSIGPNTSPANLNGGDFDGSISFDDAQPFQQLGATLM